MISAMNTGHEGSLTTLHANAPKEAISRLVTMVRFAAELPVDVIESQIATAFSLIVQTSRSASGARVVSCVSGVSFDEASRSCVVEDYYERDERTGFGFWKALPDWGRLLSARDIASEEEVERWKQRLRFAS